MKLGSLFSGGGLGDFGFLASGMEIAWQCEIDPYCQKILALRYPESKKYTDIKTLKGAELEQVDIITGGFPCQPFSVAGKQMGNDDHRSLWSEMLRVITECRPRWVIGENVLGIVNMELENICFDLEAEGYEVWPLIFPAHAVGASHRRERLWIVCNSEYNGQSTSKECRSIGKRSNNSKEGKNKTSEPKRPVSSFGRFQGMANANSDRLQRSIKRLQETGQSSTVETLLRTTRLFFKDDVSTPRICGKSDGITKRMERLKMLGNGQVPACTYVIGKMIMEIESPNTD